MYVIDREVITVVYVLYIKVIQEFHKKCIIITVINWIQDVEALQNLLIPQELEVTYLLKYLYINLFNRKFYIYNFFFLSFHEKWIEEILVKKKSLKT